MYIFCTASSQPESCFGTQAVDLKKLSRQAHELH